MASAVAPVFQAINSFVPEQFLFEPAQLRVRVDHRSAVRFQIISDCGSSVSISGFENQIIGREGENASR
jgi:hypothetical protein